MPQKYNGLQRMIKYNNKLYNLEDMNKFLEIEKVPKLKQEEIESTNRSITSKDNHK